MLSKPIEDLVAKISHSSQFESKTSTSGEIFEVNRIISKVATLYEKARYLVDYREEHTIRRSAIERILSRKIMFEHSDNVAHTLLIELVNGEYITSDTVSDSLERSINTLIQKFVYVMKDKGGAANQKWFLGLASSQIDRLLNPYEAYLDDILTDAFYEKVRSGISIPQREISDIDTEVYLATRRGLTLADNEMLSYALWRKHFPTWETGSLEDSSNDTQAVSSVVGTIKKQLADPLRFQIAQKIKNETIYFIILRELVRQYGAESLAILEDGPKLDDFIKSFLAKKYAKENERMQKAGIRAVGYLFFTKVILALVIEVPYDLLVSGGIVFIPLLTNIFFHPLLLLLLTRGISTLDNRNTDAIMKGVHTILYEDTIRQISIKKDYSLTATSFATMYVFFTLAIFAAILLILHSLAFSLLSIALFLFFVALASYFAFRIRFNAKRWSVIRKQGFLVELGRTIGAPVVGAGQWLSRTFSSINVFVFVLDFIVETPFKFLLNISDQFITYIKGQNDEVY